MFVGNGILARNTPVGRRGFFVWRIRFPVAGVGRGVPGCEYGGFVEVLAVGGVRVCHYDGPDLSRTCFYQS